MTTPEVTAPLDRLAVTLFSKRKGADDWFQLAKLVSLTTDIFTIEKTKYSCITVVVHFILQLNGYKMKLQSRVLNTFYFPVIHDAAAQV